MEEELQELRDLVTQLQADNGRLQQEQAAAVPGPSAAPPTSACTLYSFLHCYCHLNWVTGFCARGEKMSYF